MIEGRSLPLEKKSATVYLKGRELGAGLKLPTTRIGSSGYGAKKYRLLTWPPMNCPPAPLPTFFAPAGSKGGTAYATSATDTLSEVEGSRGSMRHTTEDGCNCEGLHLDGV